MTWKNDMKKSIQRAVAQGNRVFEDAAVDFAVDLFNRFYVEPPTVPRRTGALRASGVAAVNGRIVATGGGDISAASIPRPKPGVIDIYFGFHADYALYVHEIQYDIYTEPGSGPFFISSKLDKGADLMNRFAQDVKIRLDYQLGSK
jgi:hypothetical protein